MHRHGAHCLPKNPELLDDGKPRDFEKFSKEMGAEYFTGIDKVENHGKDIYGPFHSDTWGDFKTYFKFRIAENGKIDQLEIGQAVIEFLGFLQKIGSLKDRNLCNWTFENRSPIAVIVKRGCLEILDSLFVYISNCRKRKLPSKLVNP